MRKISISSWAIPQPLDELCAGAKKIGYDGISLGGFPPFGAHPDIVDTPEKKAALVKTFKDAGLEVADYALDMWKYDALKQTAEWRAEYTRALKCAAELGLTKIMRVDTCTPPILPEGMSYDEVKQFFVKHFTEMANEAAEYGFDVVWEFEPGFMINEPKNVKWILDNVKAPNFSLLFDTCHAYNCALGHRHIEEGCKLEGGVEEFIELVKAEHEKITVCNEYTFDFTCQSELVNQYGRVIGQGNESQIVTYTVTITHNGETESIELASMIKGAYLK